MYYLYSLIFFSFRNTSFPFSFTSAFAYKNTPFLPTNLLQILHLKKPVLIPCKLHRFSPKKHHLYKLFQFPPQKMFTLCSLPQIFPDFLRFLQALISNCSPKCSLCALCIAFSSPPPQIAFFSQLHSFNLLHYLRLSVKNSHLSYLTLPSEVISFPSKLTSVFFYNLSCATYVTPASFLPIHLYSP